MPAIPRYVIIGRMFDANFKADEELTTPKEIWTRFEDLSSDLSPENLYADGERTNAQAAKLKAEIMARWRVLEGKIGRSVTEQEVWENIMARANRNR